MCAVAEAADSLIESLWPSSAARRRSGDAGDDACELVLADGTRLGHRSLHAYYRQKFRPDDGRLTVRTNLREGHLTWLRARRQRAALEARLATREAARARYRLLVRGAAAAKGGTSKALAAQSNFKASFADNKHARALMHHGYGGFGGGAHYVPKPGEGSNLAQPSWSPSPTPCVPLNLLPTDDGGLQAIPAWRARQGSCLSAQPAGSQAQRPEAVAAAAAAAAAALSSSRCQGGGWFWSYTSP